VRAWGRVAALAALLLVTGCDSGKRSPKAEPVAVGPTKPAAPAQTAQVQAAQAEPDDGEQTLWTEWTTLDDPESKTYRVAPYTLATSREKSLLGETYAVLTISTPGADEPLKLKGPTTGHGDAPVHAEFGVFIFDKRYPDPQLLVRFFTYGEHCCYAYRLVDRRGGRWSVHDLSDWDAVGSPDPVDVDGDGAFEMVGADQTFFYAFESYAGSTPPPAVWRVEGGKLADVSTDRRYRGVYEKAVADEEDWCRQQRTPGTCLRYAATMARLDRLDDAWPLVERVLPLEQVDVNDCWNDRVVCLGRRVVHVRSFHEKVERFLAYKGYFRKDPS
jgi:hypothetical protein